MCSGWIWAQKAFSFACRRGRSTGAGRRRRSAPSFRNANRGASLSGPDRSIPKALLLGCRGLALAAEERRFFASAQPLGFILFARNCADPAQLRALVQDLKDCVGRAAPILIDQEGGRVCRLPSSHWRVPPAAARFGELADRDPAAAAEAAWLNARLLAAELDDLGIDVDCAPVLDLPERHADSIIGDRAFGGDADRVAMLGAAMCEGFLAGGVLPVLKHIPGHGRARVDSHKALPVVTATAAELAATDFRPFSALADMPLAMTAHIVYSAFDAEAPATLSKTVVTEVIRKQIGFDGLLMTDDLSMGALEGDLAMRAETALAAGCDLVLHCNGEFDEMTALAAAVGPLAPAAQARLARAQSRQRDEKQDADLDEIKTCLAAHLGEG